jgi:peptide/nickel transport system substrate-binding protein
MSWIRRSSSSVLAALIMFCLVATAGSVSAATGPTAGGSLKFLSSIALSNLDPALGNPLPSPNNETPAYLAVFDGLLSPDSVKGVAKPRIGSMSTKDSTVWVLKIRSGVKFSDGTMLDASAVKTNWDRIKNTTTSPARPNFDDVISYVVSDPLTMTITLKAPNPDFAYALSTYAQNYIVSAQQLTSSPTQVARSPIGAGPYTVKEFVANSTLTLVKNPNYYGTTYLDSITMSVVIDESQRFATIQSNGADLMRSTDPATSAKAKSAGLNITNLNTAGGMIVLFNMSKPPFNDLRARQAIAYALDSEAMVSGALTGGETALTLFPKGSPYYDASIRQVKPSDKKAQALFDQLAADGKPLSFTLGISSTTIHSIAAQWLQTKLASFKNVTMKINQLLAGSTVSTFFTPGNFEAGLYLNTGVTASDFAQYLQTGAAKNFARVADPAMDAALRKLGTASNADARVAAAKSVQEIYFKTIPAVFYARNPNFIIVGKSVKGYSPSAYYYNVPDWTKLWKSTS